MKFLKILILAIAITNGIAMASPVSDQVQHKHDKIGQLVNELADERFSIRESATKQLWSIGHAAAPALEAAMEVDNPEQSIRARDLLKKIRLDVKPDSDPKLIELVDSYEQSSPTEKRSIMRKLKGLKAWIQILKLYASEEDDDIRTKFAATVSEVAVRAAREKIISKQFAAAKELLELGPANQQGLLSLAEFHRVQGTLELEQQRMKGVAGVKAAAWRLALARSAGEVSRAVHEASLIDEPWVMASMSGMIGDPLPWLELPPKVNKQNINPAVLKYRQLAVMRWQGLDVDSPQATSLIRDLKDLASDESTSAMNALFMLNQHDLAESALIEASPLDAFRHFIALERASDALRAIGLDEDPTKNQAWVTQRVKKLALDQQNKNEGFTNAIDHLLAYANFLESRGLLDESYALYSEPLLELALNHEAEFTDFWSQLYGRSELASGSPQLATSIAAKWAGHDADRWTKLYNSLFGQEGAYMAWWNLLPKIDPHVSMTDRFYGMLALFRIGPDPEYRRKHWLSSTWKFADQMKGDERELILRQIHLLSSIARDARTSIQASKDWITENETKTFWGQQALELSATEKWLDAAKLILAEIEKLDPTGNDSVCELHAYAAAALRRAGEESQAKTHDLLADQLSLGSASTAIQIGNGYAFGYDYERATQWWKRAVLLSDPQSMTYQYMLKLYGDELVRQGQWLQAASISEILSDIYTSSDFRWEIPLMFMRQRLQGDMCRALSMLPDHKPKALEILKRCHHDYTLDGALADSFFPSLKKAGLIQEHDQMFEITWSQLKNILDQHPRANNVKNTTAWFAAKSQMKLDEGERYLKELLRQYPYQPAYLDTMAEIQFAKGNRQAAIEWSRKAINFSPDESELRRQHLHFLKDSLPSANP